MKPTSRAATILLADDDADDRLMIADAFKELRQRLLQQIMQ